MGNNVVVPKQQVPLSFKPIDWLNVVNYIKLLKAYNLEFLGIELVPLNDRYWEFNPFVTHYRRRRSECYNFLGSNPTAQHEGWIALPEMAKIVVKNDITVERLFQGLRADNFLTKIHSVPDIDREYYYFQRLFQNVPNQKTFKKKLSKILDAPPVSETSTTISIPVFEKKTGQKVQFEFTVTELATWKFVRIAGVEYNGSRFKYWVDMPGGINIYSTNHKSIDLLKNYLIGFTESSVTGTAFWLMQRFMHVGTERVFLNEEMALHLCLERFEIEDNVALVEFKTIEPDYTTFLE
jgi:hypothetical protein